MGLPLFRAPVESDIKAKVPKDPPTRARSTIRRDRRTVGIGGSETSSGPPHRFYARRRGRLVSPRATDLAWSPWDNVGSEDAAAPSRPAPRRPAFTTEPYPLPDDSTRPHDPSRSARQTDSALREVVSRNGMSQEMARYFGEHMARLHAATSSRPSHIPEDSNERVETETVPGDLESRAWFVASEHAPTGRLMPRFTATSESRQTDASTRVDVGESQSSSIPPQRFADVVLRRHDGHLIAMRRLRAVRVARTPGDATQQDASPVDGLGDRNRSLSPEDDGVWDTLLSSITPDPQPPSVGTSFASTSAPASAGASQSTGGSASASTSTSTSTSTSASAHTHITAPATLEALERDGVFDFEQPCDDNNTDTEGDDDDEEERRVNTLRRFARQRSYADVVGRREDEDLEMLGEGGVDDMQRIVRNLARREDIPDEWWAEVGLSRSLPREA